MAIRGLIAGYYGDWPKRQGSAMVEFHDCMRLCWRYAEGEVGKPTLFGLHS